MNSLMPVILDTQEKMDNFPKKYNLTTATQEESRIPLHGELPKYDTSVENILSSYSVLCPFNGCVWK